jgi:hypothetical protein
MKKRILAAFAAPKAKAANLPRRTYSTGCVIRSWSRTARHLTGPRYHFANGGGSIRGGRPWSQLRKM